MKNILIWIGAGIGAFVILVGITFAVLTFLDSGDNPEIMNAVIMDNKVAATKIIEEKDAQIDSLKSMVNDLNSQLFFAKIAYDSVNEQIQFKDGMISEYEKQIETLNKQVAANGKVDANIKEVAKTYETMKVEEMRPIFASLDDETVISIYQNVSSRNRKKILQALSYNRAAAITQWLAGEQKE